MDNEHEFAEDEADDDLDYLEEEDEQPDILEAQERRITISQTEEQRFTGRNGHKWKKEPKVRTGRAAAPRQILYVPAAHRTAENLTTPMAIWNTLITDKILDKIVLYTNEGIRRRIADRKERSIKEQSYYNECSKNEILAAFGLLYLTRMLKSSKVNKEELWSAEFGASIFRAIMSLQRFSYLLVVMRFDDKNTRDQRVYSDNFAAIREVWINSSKTVKRIIRQAIK